MNADYLQVSIIPNVDTQFSNEEKVSLFEFLPENTVIWIQDEDVLKERLLNLEEELEQFLRTEHSEKVEEAEDKLDRKNVTRKDFIEVSQFASEMEQKHLVYFGYQKPFHAVIEIEFQTKEQPAFNRQFDLLIADLKNWEKKLPIYSICRKPKTIRKAVHNFQGSKAEINFNPVATSIHEGFIDDDLKMVCYTDHQIFQRYHKYRVKQAYNKNKALTLTNTARIAAGRLCNTYRSWCWSIQRFAENRSEWKVAGSGSNYL